jgi:hypothetical protein
MQFAPIRHAPPQESRCPLIEAWRTYTNGTALAAPEPTREELNTIYMIGLCRALSDGRSGVLTNMPGEREWSRCREFLRLFRERIHALVDANRNKPILCRLTANVVEGVSATADMLVDQTAWFFVGGDQISELQRLDRMICVLLTVHALRLAGHTVKQVCLYQLITGQMLTWSVEDWSPKSAALLAAFVEARVKHVTSSQN